MLFVRGADINFLPAPQIQAPCNVLAEIHPQPPVGQFYYLLFYAQRGFPYFDFPDGIIYGLFLKIKIAAFGALMADYRAFRILNPYPCLFHS